MKISGTPPIGPLSNIQATNRISSAKSSGKSVTPPNDGVSVSDAAGFHQILTQKVKALPDIREDRVQEIQAKIASGEFKIDAQGIAAKMLGE